MKHFRRLALPAATAAYLATKRPEPARAGFFPTSDGDYFVTADHVIDEPREPTIVPIGVLDAQGEMLVRITIPVRLPTIGFHLPPGSGQEADCVEAILPENMVAVSDIGVGIGHVTPAEIEDDE